MHDSLGWTDDPLLSGLRVAGAVLLASIIGVGAAAAEDRVISCLGRLEPGDGVIRIASPSGGGVIDELLVVEGDHVEADQLIATLATRSLYLADVERLQAQLEEAQNEAARLSKLALGNAASSAKYDSAQIGVRVAKAGVAAARAQLEMSEVRAPINAEVLEVHARAGEIVGLDGVVELGETSRMFAVAEVYETDIGLVSRGQKATVSSPALGEPLTGTVDRIGLKVGRMDVLGTDPIAKTDARVVEVRIALDDAERASGLTHLQVEVEIGP